MSSFEDTEIGRHLAALISDAFSRRMDETVLVIEGEEWLESR